MQFKYVCEVSIQSAMTTTQPNPFYVKGACAQQWEEYRLDDDDITYLDALNLSLFSISYTDQNVSTNISKKRQ